MKKGLLALVVLIVAVQFAFGFDQVLTYFRGHADSDSIGLDWQSGNETGVRSYHVERSDIKGDNFTEVGSVVATGSNSTYHYRDASFSSIQQQGGSNGSVPMSDLYKYRLKLVYDNAISYSQPISVTRPSASVKLTWGMIKEMFH